MVDINDLEKRISDLEKKIGYPIDITLQRAIENVIFSKLNVSKIYGGLPIYTITRNDQKNRETYLTKISGVAKICSFLDGTEYCATLT